MHPLKLMRWWRVLCLLSCMPAGLVFGTAGGVQLFSQHVVLLYGSFCTQKADDQGLVNLLFYLMADVSRQELNPNATPEQELVHRIKEVAGV